MIKVENISADKICKIGVEIGKTFMAEEGIFPSAFTLEEGIEYFRTIVEIYYDAGCLYTTSENYEGFLAYWTKNEKPKLSLWLKMIYLLLKRIPFSSLYKLIKSLKGWKGYEEQYKNEKNYVVVHMLVVLREFQGKGIMKKIMDTPFSIARTKKVLCVLETDSRVKSEKYIHCGMKITEQRKLSNSMMYIMEYE